MPFDSLPGVSLPRVSIGVGADHKTSAHVTFQQGGGDRSGTGGCSWACGRFGRPGRTGFGTGCLGRFYGFDGLLGYFNGRVRLVSLNIFEQDAGFRAGDREVNRLLEG